MVDREKMIAKIRALVGKTTAAGCTEAEAMAAAEKAAALMREYQIGGSELFIDQTSVRSRTSGQSPRDRLWLRLTWCTSTATILNYDQAGRPTRTFVGREPGPEIAAYLYVVLDRAIDRAVADFKAGPYYARKRTLRTKRQAVAEFTEAMVFRLIGRLGALFASTRSEAASDEAASALAERFPNSVTVPTKKAKNRKITAAVISGILAGEAVHLAHGMSNGTDSPRLLGKAGA